MGLWLIPDPLHPGHFSRLDFVTTSSYNESMKAVGVKALKARISEFLRLVKAGETILVTERDTVVAELRPAHRQNTAPDSLEDGLAALAERGEATLRSDDNMKWDRPGMPFRLDGVSSRQILDAIREDRP